MKTIKTYANEWNANAKEDPLWAILTAENKKERKWEDQEFFQTGEMEIKALFSFMQKHQLKVKKGSALDFGCGVGRLSRALKKRFKRVVALDISEEMVAIGKEKNPEIEFVVNERDDLSLLASSAFDFVYSSIVMQHIAPREQVKYLAELGRVLRYEGILAIQIPSQKKLRSLGDILKLFFPSKFKQWVYRKIKKRDAFEEKFTFEMHCMKEKEVIALCKKAGLLLKKKVFTNSTDPNFNGNLQFYTVPSQSKARFISILYFFQKCAT